MPAWTQGFGIAAGLIISITIIVKLIVMIYKAARKFDRAIKPIEQLADVFERNPNFIRQMSEVAAEFKTDHGTTIKDQMDRLEKFLEEHEGAIASVQTELGVASELAKRDREQADQAIALIQEMMKKDREVAIDLADKEKTE